MALGFQTIKLTPDTQSYKIPESRAGHYNTVNKETQDKQAKSSKTKTALAILCGTGSAFVSTVLLALFSQEPFVRKLYKLTDELTVSGEKFIKISENMVKENHLREKGFDLIIADQGLKEIVTSKLEKKFTNSSNYHKFKTIPMTPREMAKDFADELEPSLRRIEEGKSPLYHPASNLAISSKKRACAMPHEIGHAINNNKFGFIGKALSCPSILPVIALPIILLTALLHTKKENNNKSNTEKIRDFIQDHAGILTFSSFIPQLIDEGTASYHSIKAARKVLTKPEFNAYKKMLRTAWGCYLMIPISAGLGMGLGIYVKNKLLKTDKTHNPNNHTQIKAS